MGRHPKPLYEREVVKGPFRTASIAGRILLFDPCCRAPSCRPDPQYLNAVARRAGQGWPSTVRATRA